MKKDVILTLSHINGFAIMPKKNAQNNIKNRAFTLVELAIVILIIGLIAGMGVSTAREMIDAANLTATQNRIDTVEKALLSFWKKNGRMPCPADITLANSHANYGIEATGSDTCTGGAIAANFPAATSFYKAAEGAVPVITLGLPKDFVYDGWGHRIAYAVTPTFTRPYASTRIQLRNSICLVDTAIKIADIAGGNRSTSAVYALVSYGKNGHGSYSSGSTRLNVGSSNADELINCHCTSAAANSTYDGNYVQRSQNLNSGNQANYFDDIVRYKERWQLSTAEDALNDDGYRGADLAIAYQKAVTGTVYTYKNQCGVFVKQEDLSPPPSEIPLSVAFTPGNKHLVSYSANGCDLYKITGAGIPVEQSSAFSTTCSYNPTGKMILANNGFLAVADNTNIRFWRHSGDTFIKLPTISDLVNTDTLISFSADATYLAALPTATGTTVPVYKRRSNIFSNTGVSAPSHTVPTTVKNSVAFSPDGKYLAATSSANIYLWRVLANGSFVALTTISPVASTALTGITFSPDGLYFAVGRAETPYLIIYKIDPNDTFTALTAPTGVPVASTGTGFAFSKDSNYLIMLTADTDYPALAFQKTSVSSFKYMTYPFPVGAPTSPLDDILPVSVGAAAAFIR